MQDAIGSLGGSLILSTSGTGSTSASNSQPTDRLIIDSNGLASFTGSVILSSTSSTLTASGNTILGTGGSQSLTINAATTFASTAAITANAPVTLSPSAPLTAQAAITASSSMTVAGSLTASGNTVLGTDNTSSLTVNAAPTFNVATTFASLAAITANAPISAYNAVTVTGLLTAGGNSVLGTNSNQTLTINANTTFSSSFQMYSNSPTPGSGAVLGFGRQNNGTAVRSGFTLGSILFSGYDGASQGPTAQIRSVNTVSPWTTPASIQLYTLPVSFELVRNCSHTRKPNKPRLWAFLCLLTKDAVTYQVCFSENSSLEYV